MARLERKQVLKVGDTTSQLSPVADKPTPAMANTSLHGLVGDLTQTGVGFEATP